MDDFLAAADDLKLSGLTGEPQDPLVRTSKKKDNDEKIVTNNGEKKTKQFKKEVAFDMRFPKMEEGFEASGNPENLPVNSVFSPSKKAVVEEKLMSMMERLRERSEYKWRCKVCLLVTTHSSSSQ